MNSDTPLDYAIFQLSPRRSRCELVVSGDGKTEKLASGHFKPFLAHLKAAEEQETESSQTIKLNIEKKRGNAGSWFHKGTLERFVRFVSTPEVLEAISTLDVEMSQLEGAKRIYCQGGADPLSGTLPGEGKLAEITPGDATKKELLRAIDVRLTAVKQELTSACARASSAGFTLESISDLRLFADYFGAQRLNSACTKFLSLCQRRPELITLPKEYYHNQQQMPTPPPVTQKAPSLRAPERDVRGSSGSDMSIDDPEDAPLNSALPSSLSSRQGSTNQNNTTSLHQPRHFRACSVNLLPNQDQKPSPVLNTKDELPVPPVEGSRRLSVQDRISMFESKQKEQSGGRDSGKAELRRLSSDPSLLAEKVPVRRWSGASDMSLDLSSNNGNINSCKEAEIASNEEKDTAESQPSASASLGNPKAKVDSLVHSVASLRFSEESESASQLSDQARLKSSPGEINAELNTPFSSTSLQKKPGSTQFKASGSSKIATVHSQDKQKISVDKAEDAHTQSRGKYFHKKSEKLGKPELDSCSKENQPSLQKVLHSRANERVHIQVIQDVGDEVKIKSDTNYSGSSALESSFAAGSSNQNQGSNEELQMRAENLKLDSHGKIFPKKSEKLGKPVFNLESQGIQISVPSRKGFRGRVKESVDIQATQDLSDVEQLKSESFDLSSSSTVESSSAASSSKGNQGLNGELQMKTESRKLQSHGKSLPRKSEKLGKSELYLDTQKKLTSTPRFHDRVNERVESEATQDLNKVQMKSDDFDFSSTTETSSATRSSKGNQGLNEELQMKADELEKIFAAHKLRLQVDQTSSMRRGKAVDYHVENVNLTERRSPCKNSEPNFDQEFFTDAERKNLSYPSFPEDSKGILFERYMQKREAKLKEEWDLKRDQKEAKMKKMHDDLERSKAEMARYSGSSRRLDSRVSYHSRAEQLRSFSFNLSVQSKEDKVNDGFVQSTPNFRSSVRGQSMDEEVNLVNAEINSGRSQSMRSALSVSRKEFSQDELKVKRAFQRKGMGADFGKSKLKAPGLTLDPQQREEEAVKVADSSALSDYWDDDYDDDDDGDDDDDDNDSAAPLVNASIQESAGESPDPWNDASMDSSGGSSAQTDVSRMRRKWGNTQKPVMASNSCNQVRRETSKGFKRLLTFGRKQKGGLTEGQHVDWVSAYTASEGEEDGIMINLEKSRVGTSHCHYVHDDQFYDQGGRSLFSLSTVRAKGARPRPV